MFLKDFLKNLRRYSTSSALNIIGLAIAFASAYIILVQVNFDLSYNKCFRDADRVFRVEMESRWGEKGTWMPAINNNLGYLFGENDDNVESFGTMRMYTSNLTILVPNQVESDKMELMNIRESWGTRTMPQTMGFTLVQGDFERLKEPNTIVMSERFAQTHNLTIDNTIKDAMGRTLTIVGLFKDFPRNSDLYGLDIFVGADDNMNNPSEWSYTYYYKLISAEQKDAFLHNIYTKLYDGQFKDDVAAQDSITIDDFKKEFPFRLTALEDTYFATNMSGAQGQTGNRTTTLTLLAIAALIIVIAFVNFINFFMAMVPRRIRRVNTEKVFGCPTWRLRGGFVFEAVGLVTIALLIAAVIIFILAPSGYINSTISTSIALEDNVMLVLLTVAAGLVLAVLTSIYPAWYITSMPPAFVVKGSFGNTKSGRRLRYTLLGFQFVISIALITCSIFVKLQHTYMMNYDMGFNKSHLLTTNIPVSINKEYSSRQTFAGLLKENPMIADVTFADGDIVNQSRMGWGRGFKGEQISFQCYPVSHDFLRFMGIDITEGRDFMPDDERTNGTFIFNESARKEFGLELGDKVYGHNGEAPVVGFCEDFKFRPLQYGVSPFAFYVFGTNGWRGYSHLYVRTVPQADIAAVKQHITDCIIKMDAKVTPDNVVIDSFDKELGAEYEKEQELTTLITIFSVLSIVISLLGVFGLVYFETQYRRREIALRRVHGAQIREILQMFVVQYAKMVGIAFVVAAPISTLIMMRWLQTFAYHTPLHWWVFLIALAIVLAVTSAIVVARSWKAARENPVNALYKE